MLGGDAVKRWLLPLFAGACLVLCMTSGGALAQDGDPPKDHHMFLPMVFRPVQYSFFVAGHPRNYDNNIGLYPPFRARFSDINALNPDFGVFTGDMVIYGTPANWDAVDADVALLNMPVYFVVGNHDMTNRDLFVSRYGPTYYSFEYGGDLFIALDSELDNGSVTGNQFSFLSTVLQESHARRVFLFVHRMIWITEDSPYYPLRTEVNIWKAYDPHANFWNDVLPLLLKVDAPVYIIAGDVGMSWAMPLFCDEYENVRFVASGMGGSEEENFLTFHVLGDNVQVKAYRLDGRPLNLGTVEAYNLEYYTQP